MGDAAEVARARRGDEDAFRGLVERYSSLLFRVAYRITGNPEDAEDVVQETFLKAFRRLDQYEERASFGSWLHPIAVRTACDLLRRRRAQPARVEIAADAPDPLDAAPAPDPSPDRLLEGREVHDHLGRALERLSRRERAAFVLRHFEQMSTREIAAALGMDEGTVKQSVFRAVRKLRPLLLPLVAPHVGTETS
jgi:RNA polymerase sigma-70 factor, ECF subfamily